MATTTITVHRCSACTHPDAEHRTAFGRCCSGYCECRLASGDVIERNPAITRETLPAYDPGAKRWLD